MDRKQVVYEPTREQLENLSGAYVELWRGLPDVQFEDVATRGGDSGWRYNQNGDYIWISPDARNAYESDPQTLFVAIMQKEIRGSIRAAFVDPAKDSIEIMRDRVIMMNDGFVQESIARREAKIAKKVVGKI